MKVVQTLRQPLMLTWPVRLILWINIIQEH
jgi:hypothetical protein